MQLYLLNCSYYLLLLIVFIRNKLYKIDETKRDATEKNKMTYFIFTHIISDLFLTIYIRHAEYVSTYIYIYIYIFIKHL